VIALLDRTVSQREVFGGHAVDGGQDWAVVAEYFLYCFGDRIRVSTEVLAVVRVAQKVQEAAGDQADAGFVASDEQQHHHGKDLGVV